MASEIHNGYAAEKYALVFKYAKPVINLAFLFYESDDETELDFSEVTNATFKVWEEEENGRLLLTVSNGDGLTLSGNTITMNTSAGQMTPGDGRGKYYYELSYYTSGGYEYLLMFGEAKFI
jgi:hypothetical protein